MPRWGDLPRLEVWLVNGQGAEGVYRCRVEQTGQEFYCRWKVLMENWSEEQEDQKGRNR